MFPLFILCISLLLTNMMSCQEPHKSCSQQIRYYEQDIQKKIETLNPYQFDSRVDNFIDQAVPFLRQLHAIDDKNSCLTEALAHELVALEKKYVLISTFVALVLIGERRNELLKNSNRF